MTLKEFAKRVNISPQTLSRYIKSGKVTPRRYPSNIPYFLEEDIAAFNHGVFHFGVKRETAND
jgi:predicted site-specific integrase-resolvase